MRTIDSFSGEYRFLSNFHPCLVRIDNIAYTSSEHAYMAHKTLDIQKRCYIASLATPAIAKREGRKLQLRPDWEQVKFDVMGMVVYNKFDQNPDLKQKLLDTGDAHLVEGNHWGDVIWGVCKGVGTNWLGQVLMMNRDYFRSQL